MTTFCRRMRFKLTCSVCGRVHETYEAGVKRPHLDYKTQIITQLNFCSVCGKETVHNIG